MDWTLEDNMFDCLFFCATLTGLKRGHTRFAQAGAESPDTGVEADKPDPGFSCEGNSGWVPVSGMKINEESCGVVRPLRITLVIHPVRRIYDVVVVRGTDELLCGGYKWVSRFETPCICTRWMDER